MSEIDISHYSIEGDKEVYNTTYKDASLWERVAECSFWVKYCLFTINFLVWCGGVALIGIGVWSRAETQQLGAFDRGSADPAFMLIAVGIIMFLISIFGCIGALRENICLLKTFCLIIAIVFIIEILAGILAFVFIDDTRESLIQVMHAGIVKYGEDDDLRDAINYVQRRFKCCGASSYSDWEANVYFNCSSPASSRCGVPMSCCKVKGNAQCGYASRLQGEAYAAFYIHTKGCIDALMVVFKDNLIVVGLIAFVVGFVELIAIMLAITMVRNIYMFMREHSDDIRLRSVSLQHSDSDNFQQHSKDVSEESVWDDRV